MSASSCHTSDKGMPRVDCSVGCSKGSKASKASGVAKDGARNHVGIEQDDDEGPAWLDVACEESV